MSGQLTPDSKPKPKRQRSFTWSLGSHRDISPTLRERGKEARRTNRGSWMKAKPRENTNEISSQSNWRKSNPPPDISISPIDFEDGKVEEGVLFVAVLEARGLSNKESKESKIAAYVSLKGSFNRQQFKTQAAKGSYQPKWNEKFSFYTGIGSECSGTITLKVHLKGILRTHALGTCVIDLAKEMPQRPTVEKWFNLVDKKGKTTGDIKIRLSVNSSASRGESSMKLEDPKERKISDYYNIEKELGRGGFSIVKLGINKTTGEKVAVKIVQKSRKEVKTDLDLLRREIEIMKKMNHRNIIKLNEVYEDENTLYIVMELVNGGELFDEIVKRGFYSEKDAADTVRQILEAVVYMHQIGVAHRDLKPENLLIEGNTIKISDFGLSKRFDIATLQTCCGTPDYAAPEVLMAQPYDNGIDIWAVGVITYILLCGFPPFYGDTDQAIFKKILIGKFEFPSPEWDEISDEAKDFVRSMLVLDPAKRPTAAQCLENPWITGNAPERKLSSLDSFRTHIQNYTEARKKI